METVDEILERIHLKRAKLDDIPVNLIKKIFMDLSYREISMLCRTYRKFNSVCKDESLWKNKVWFEFGIDEKLWNNESWEYNYASLAKWDMINLSREWINGMTYREIIEEVVYRSEFELEEKLDIDESRISISSNNRYTIRQLKNFIENMREMPIIVDVNPRAALVSQINVILNIGIAGLIDLQIQYFPALSDVSPNRMFTFISEILGHFYGNFQYELGGDLGRVLMQRIARSHLRRDLSSGEFELIQRILTREFAIVIIATSRSTRWAKFIFRENLYSRLYGMIMHLHRELSEESDYKLDGHSVESPDFIMPGKSMAPKYNTF